MAVTADESKSRAELLLELERVRTALRRSEEHYRALVAASTDAILIFDVESGRCIGQSPAARRLFDYDEDESRFLTARMLISDEHAAEFDRLTADLRTSGRARCPRIGLCRKDGTPFWADMALTVYETSGRRLMVCVARDITAAVEREEAVQRQKEILQSVFDNIPVMLVVFDEDGTVTLINREAERALGWTLEEWRSIDVLVRMYPKAEDRRHIRDFWQAALPVWKDFRTVSRQKQVRDLSWYSVRLSGGGLIAIAQDITERKSAELEVRDLEAQLRQQQRLQSIGTLAAGVAHEINNPLAFIIGNLEYIREELFAGRDEPMRMVAADMDDAIRAALDGAERIQKIVRELKPLSRPQHQKLGAVMVSVVVDAMLRMANHEIRHRARLVRDYQDVPPVHGDESRLAQVFLNILINATQALPVGRAEDNEIRVSVSMASDERVCVEIGDTGSGIPPEVIERIFDPFFTTKPMGQGTGLGLSICHSIVKSLGGEIQVRSTMGQGTTFRVLLPVAKQSAITGPINTAPSQHRIERVVDVLVVDDEPDVLGTICRILRGHRLTVAASGREALSRLGERAYDVILCDVMMPDVSGPELFAELRAAQPGLEHRIVFMTAGAFTDSAQEFLMSVHNRVISKPFDSAELRALVSTMGKEALESAEQQRE